MAYTWIKWLDSLGLFSPVLLFFSHSLSTLVLNVLWHSVLFIWPELSIHQKNVSYYHTLFIHCKVEIKCLLPEGPPQCFFFLLCFVHLFIIFPKWSRRTTSADSDGEHAFKLFFCISTPVPPLIILSWTHKHYHSHIASAWWWLCSTNQTKSCIHSYEHDKVSVSLGLRHILVSKYALMCFTFN